MEASMKMVEAFMEAVKASTEVVEYFMKASIYFHEKSK